METLPLIIRVSWRSIWRNRRRTWITLSAIAFGLALAVFFISFAEGVYNQLIDDATRMQGGHFTLEHPQYREAPAIDLFVKNVSELRAKLEALEGVRGTKALILGQGVVTSGSGGVGVAIMGVEPEVEVHTSPLAEHRAGREDESESLTLTLRPCRDVPSSADELEAMVQEKVPHGNHGFFRSMRRCRSCWTKNRKEGFQPFPSGRTLPTSMARLLAFIIAACPAIAHAESELTPRQILDRVDDLYRGESSRAIMVMKVVTENWTRELELEAWSRGKEQSLFRILSPHKEKGTATLKSGKHMWNYLPKVNRVIKMPSSMMGSSWMGSHFTNNDLVKESRMAEDYDFEYGEPRNTDEIAILCLPGPEAPVVWGKVVVRVRREDWMPIEVEYFHEDMALARAMTFSEYRTSGERLLPFYMRITPTDKPQEHTEIVYKEIEFDLALSDDLFSLRSLRK